MWAKKTLRLGERVVAYRIYCMDGAGSIHLADWIDAKSDDEAVKVAREMHPDATKCEVWDKDRLVASLPPRQRAT